MKLIYKITCTLKAICYFCLRNKSNNRLSKDKINAKSINRIGTIRAARFLWPCADKANKRAQC